MSELATIFSALDKARKNHEKAEAARKTALEAVTDYIKIIRLQDLHDERADWKTEYHALQETADKAENRATVANLTVTALENLFKATVQRALRADIITPEFLVKWEGTALNGKRITTAITEAVRARFPELTYARFSSGELYIADTEDYPRHHYVSVYIPYRWSYEGDRYLLEAWYGEASNETLPTVDDIPAIVRATVSNRRKYQRVQAITAQKLETLSTSPLWSMHHYIETGKIERR